MESNEKLESFLKQISQERELEGDAYNDQAESLLNKLHTSEQQSNVTDILPKEPNTETIESVDYDEEMQKNILQQEALIEEHNKRIANSPEYKAEIVFKNILQSASRVLSGPEKRKLKRECLRKAKAGKYDYMFDPEKIKRREERMRAKFEAVNKGDASIKPINTKFHTVDELSSETIEELKKMATEEKSE